jgi:hypothetical protein
MSFSGGRGGRGGKEEEQLLIIYRYYVGESEGIKGASTVRLWFLFPTLVAERCY